jgi:hypothetical protein
VHRAADPLASGRISKPAFLVLVALALLALPALAIADDSVVLVLVLGWDMTLASYSYAIDSAQRRPRPALSEGLFFLLVNPTLVFAESGQRISEPRLEARGLLRLLFGVVTLLVHGVIALLLQAVAQAAPKVTTIAGNAGYLAFVAYYSSHALAIYLAHSGLASVQIALMRLLGHELPERYHYPFLARSPEEFWRRWNTWLGAWAKRYVYFPVALQLGRGALRRHKPLAKLAAVATAFVLIGFLHDVAGYTASLQRAPHRGFSPAGSALFGALCVGFLLLMGVARIPWPFAVKSPRVLTLWRPARSLIAFVLFGQFMFLATWIAMPSLSQQAFPRELIELLARLGGR